MRAMAPPVSAVLGRDPMPPPGRAGTAAAALRLPHHPLEHRDLVVGRLCQPVGGVGGRVERRVAVEVAEREAVREGGRRRVGVEPRLLRPRRLEQRRASGAKVVGRRGRRRRRRVGDLAHAAREVAEDEGVVGEEGLVHLGQGLLLRRRRLLLVRPLEQRGAARGGRLCWRLVLRRLVVQRAHAGLQAVEHLDVGVELGLRGGGLHRRGLLGLARGARGEDVRRSGEGAADADAPLNDVDGRGADGNAGGGGERAGGGHQQPRRRGGGGGAKPD
mmetsp:Transcript_48401/g.156481  ORF Transcript_48401/g.156481 Transcript_48401/m.156481 type:complete len:274 (-) Transcript_48401:139-960(-)